MRNYQTHVLVCFATVWLGVPVISPGATNILTFDFLTESGTGARSIGSFYREDGFVVASVEGLFGLATFRTNDYGYSGSASLFNDTTDGWTSLSRSNAGSFDLLGITIASLHDPFGQTINFYGYRGKDVVA